MLYFTQHLFKWWILHECGESFKQYWSITGTMDCLALTSDWQLSEPELGSKRQHPTLSLTQKDKPPTAFSDCPEMKSENKNNVYIHIIMRTATKTQQSHKNKAIRLFVTTALQIYWHIYIQWLLPWSPEQFSTASMRGHTPDPSHEGSYTGLQTQHPCLGV